MNIGRDHALLLVGSLGWMVFVVIETAGLSPRLPNWHTLSYFAHHHVVLKILFSMALASLGPIFWLHASREIAK